MNIYLDVTTSKIGNSLLIRIPHIVAVEAQDSGQTIIYTVSGDSFIVREKYEDVTRRMGSIAL